MFPLSCWILFVGVILEMERNRKLWKRALFNLTNERARCHFAEGWYYDAKSTH